MALHYASPVLYAIIALPEKLRARFAGYLAALTRFRKCFKLETRRAIGLARCC